MIRLVAVAFALAVATSAQAMSPAPLQQPDDMVTQIREACGGSGKNKWRLRGQNHQAPSSQVRTMEWRHLRSVVLRTQHVLAH